MKSTNQSVHLAAALIASVLFAMSVSAQTNLPPKPKWESSAAAGLTITRGNSDTEIVTASLLTAKKEKQNEYAFGIDGTYGKNNGEKNNEALHGFGQYNRLINDRAYGYLRLDALHDAIADVEYRITFSPGVGYYFIKNDITRLSGEVGPGFVYEKQGDDTSGYITLRLAEKLEHKFNERAKLWQTLEILPQVDNFDNTLFIAEIGVETALSQSFSLRTYLQDTYDTEPAPDREKNDMKLVAAIAYKF
jgi:putative salt-induced outer membrane protein